VAKETKATKIAGQEQAIFKLFSLGVVTNRDDWVYGSSDTEVRRRVKYLIAAYNREVGAAKKEEKTKRTAPPSNTIKWTRLVKSLLDRRVKMAFSEELLADCTYRPFNRRRLYFSKQLNEVQYRLPDMFGPAGRLRVPTIVWSDPTSQKTFMCLATDGLYDLHLVGAACGSFGAAKRVATDAGDVENVTDWALERFTSHYGAAASITKDRIFSYVYAVLHNPQYRSTYAINLKQDLPRIPFYADFAQWADWGQKLLDLHLGYEEAEPFPLKEINAPDKRLRATGQTPHVILRADKAKGEITLDTETRLEGVPASAWDYVLGNRAAIDWILDQHKEKTSKDPVIRTKFKPYSFADHKAEVVHLLKRVITVSVKTVEILTEMQSQGAVEAAPAQAQAKNIA
jgi:predicted helicase